MSNLREKIIIKNLIEEILNISATNLEIVGKKIVSHIEHQYMIHHGLNKNYNPVGYTIDAFSPDSRIAIQCSIEKNYFTATKHTGYQTPFPKIEKDIKKSIQHNSNIEKIYLISSQEEPPIFRQQFNKINIWDKIIIEIIDARCLAIHIYEQSVKNSQLAAEYGKFFPDFQQRMNMYEYYGKIPPYCNYYFCEPLFRKIINNHYKKNKICVLSGLSGAGKTQAAIDYSHFRNHEFDNIIWISGDDWKANTSLASIQRSRVGCAINVSGIFNSSKTFLIIDSLERELSEADFQELSDGFSLGNLVLITSQQNSPLNKIYVQLPEISENTAQKILPKAETDSFLYTQIINKCKFLPIILTTAREVIENEAIDREELFQDILDHPQAIEGRDGKSILTCLLEKLDEQKRINLKKLFCDGVYFHDQNFVDSYIGIIARRALQKIGILKISHLPNILYTHDIIGDIFKCQDTDYEIIHHLGKYIKKNKGNITPTILREIYITKSILYDFYKKRNEIYNWETYALLQIDSINNLELAKKIIKSQITPSISHEKLLCIIDANEIISLNIRNIQEKEQFLLKNAGQYESIINDIYHENIKIELWHHAGKCYRKVKKFDKSIECFNRVFDIDPQYHVSLLQVMMIGTQECSTEIKKIADEKSSLLIKCILDNHKSIPLRISLEAISYINSYEKIKYEILHNRAYVEKLSNILSEAAIEGIQQFYKIFYKFTSLISYQYADILFSFVDNLSGIFELRPPNIEKQYWGQLCEAFTNVFNSNKEDKRIGELSSKLAILFADYIAQNEQNKSTFIARILIKAYNSVEYFEKSINIISSLPQEDINNNHWLLYRKGEAELGINNLKIAHTTLARAYTLAKKDQRGQRWISSYERILAKCLFNQGKIKIAIKFYELAIRHCINNEKFKSQLEQEQKEIIFLSSKEGINSGLPA